MSSLARRRASSLAILWILLLLPVLALQARHTRRDLPHLSPNAIPSLLTDRDPLKNLDPSNPSSHLSKILIPRAPQTENNTQVRNYIVSKLKDLKWDVELDEFDDDTPVGRRHFANIIATKDPNASRRLIIAAHFDSKYFPNPPQNQFLGATDSAASCAMMIDLAESLNGLLDDRKKRFEKEIETDDEIVADTTLQLVFFDGEEAFEAWTDTDSIYGARHLAKKWESTPAYSGKQKRRVMDVHATQLDGIEHLVLLDLLGAANPSLKSYYGDTAWLFDSLVSVEKRLGNSGAFAYGDHQNMAAKGWKSWFRPHTQQYGYGYIGDDHVPFLQRGVPILHLIADPFPHVWHTIKDDATALDLPTMRRWNLMMRLFIAEYLHLRPEEKHARSESAHAPAVQRSDSELVSSITPA